MRLTICLLLFATAAFAGWQDENPHKTDYRRTLAWLGEPVAWSTNTVTTVTPRNETEWNWWYWVKIICGTKYGFAPTASLAEMQAAFVRAQQADPTNALIVTDALTCKQVWEQFGSKQPWTEPVAVTNTFTETVPTRYRWQDHGFEQAPTNNDLERR
jgi:hypothetical protein